MLQTARRSGRIRWEDPSIGLPFVYENGRVFALNYDGLLRAIDGDNGTVIWSQQLPGLTFTSAPTVFQGVVYVGALLE